MSAETTPEQELAVFLAAGYPLIDLVTTETRRVTRAVRDAGVLADYTVFTWDVAGRWDDEGAHSFAWKFQYDDDEGEAWKPEPMEKAAQLGAMAVFNRVAGRPRPTLVEIADRREGDRPPHPHGRELWILRDLHEPLGSKWQLRQALVSLVHGLEEVRHRWEQAVIVLVGADENLHPELKSAATKRFHWPLPTRSTASVVVSGIAEHHDLDVSETRDDLVSAGAGMTADAFNASLIESFCRTATLDPAFVADAKKAAVDATVGLTVVPADPRGLDGIGGLDLLKGWLQGQREAFRAASRPDSAASRYGLRPPKGMTLVGHAGTGKTLTGQCVATAWGVPLIKLDLGAMKGGIIGESQANVRKALAIIKAFGPCVVFIDEMEKALAGGQSRGDSGVGSDQLGQLLSWQQDQVGAFLIATVNDVQAILQSCPEILRPGRMNLISFVDLPAASERVEIPLTPARDPDAFDLVAIAAKTPDYSGAELEVIVSDALLLAFQDRVYADSLQGERTDDEEPREVTTADLLAAATATIPQSASTGDKIAALRSWAKGAASPASSPEVVARQTRKGTEQRLLVGVA